jgi:hypothetical protein
MKRPLGVVAFLCCFLSTSTHRYFKIRAQFLKARSESVHDWSKRQMAFSHYSRPGRTEDLPKHEHSRVRSKTASSLMSHFKTQILSSFRELSIKYNEKEMPGNFGPDRVGASTLGAIDDLALATALPHHSAIRRFSWR